MIGPFELNKIYCGDALELLYRLPDESVQCCVTSPPYWGLRDYGIVGQIGLEENYQQYIQKLVAIFEEVRRILYKDGLLWLNIGDSYAGSWGAMGQDINNKARRMGFIDRPPQSFIRSKNISRGSSQWNDYGIPVDDGLKSKDLCGIPWRVAFALQAAGWYLRCDIIWSKPNPMPESVTDRPTRSHEYLFLLAKSKRYYYDAEAVKEKMVDESDWEYRQRIRADKVYDLKEPYKNNFPGCPKQRKPAGWATGKDHTAVGRANEQNQGRADKQRGHSRRHAGFNDQWDAMSKAEQQSNGRNRRSVWEIATMPYGGAHFATYPKKLVEPCILAGTKPGDIVLDPFAGSGTTGVVALEHGRKFIGFDLNEKYCQELATPRLAAAERGQTVKQYQTGQLTIYDIGAKAER